LFLYLEQNSSTPILELYNFIDNSLRVLITLMSQHLSSREILRQITAKTGDHQPIFNLSSLHKKLMSSLSFDHTFMKLVIEIYQEDLRELFSQKKALRVIIIIFIIIIILSICNLFIAYLLLLLLLLLLSEHF